MLLGERPGRAHLFAAAPGSFAPDQTDRAPEAGHVDQAHVASAVAVRDHSARPAARRFGGCLDDDAHDAGVIGDVDDVEPLEANEEVAT